MGLHCFPIRKKWGHKFAICAMYFPYLCPVAFSLSALRIRIAALNVLQASYLFSSGTYLLNKMKDLG